jgi:hypothetical protein
MLNKLNKLISKIKIRKTYNLQEFSYLKITMIYIFISVFFIIIFSNITKIIADTKPIQTVIIDKSLNKKYIPTYNSINKLIEKYDYKVFVSFFSLEELRPYSIIQFDKFSENYNTKWADPNIFITELTQSDRDSLKLIITKYIYDNNDNFNYNYVNNYNLLQKVQNWNIAYDNISNIMFNYEISLTNILDQIYGISTTKVVLEKYARLGEFKSDVLSENDKNEAFHAALNRIASLSQKEQLRVFSELYQNLHLISTN